MLSLTRIRQKSQATQPARVSGGPTPTESCQLTAGRAFRRTLGAVRGINSHVLRGEVAGPVARAGRAGVQVHHDGHMVR